MADYGLTENGFKRKTREQIVEDMKLSLKNNFSNLNMTDRNPLIKIVKVVSYPIALYWFALESIYNNRWVNTATGKTLDEVALYLGITRAEGRRSVTSVLFSGDDQTFIPEGFLLETDEEEPKQFETVDSGYINGGSISLQVQSVETGNDKNVAANTITEVVNPISGLDSANNPEAAVGGTDRETDEELRERYKNSYDKAGGSTTNSIRANILEKTDTKDCIVLENTSMAIDGDGLPPKSIEAIVYGGTDESIARAIFEKRAGGIENSGDTTYILTDDSGVDQTIKFSRATLIDIFVNVDIVKNNNYPDDGDEQIKQEIVEYVNGLTINEDVIYNRLIDKVFNIQGVEDISILELDKVSPPTGTSNISIGIKEASETTSDKVVINYA